MSEFVAGNDPADHTVSEVNEFLRNGDPTADEYERVVNAEREGKGRVGIISGSGAEAEPFPAGDEAGKYPDDAPASLGPDKPKTEAEAAAHEATLEALAAAEAESVLEPAEANRPATQTPEQARAKAAEINEARRRERLGLPAEGEPDAADDGNE